MSKVDWHKRAAQASFTVRNFIDGQYQDCVGSKTIEKVAGRDGKLLYSFANGDGSEAEQAVASAKATFKSGVWRKKSSAERAAVLNKLADLVDKHKDTFALYESMDVGKPINNALGEDLARSVRGLRGAASNIDKLLGTCGTDQGTLVYQTRKPVGVVAGILGWNFPLTLAVGKVGPALITGNSLVLKPSEFTSLSTSFLAELAIEAGLPAGVFNVVHGDGINVGDRLARHMDVDLLTFVGSTGTGKLLMKAAGESNMKRLILECGGKSPFMVFDDCEEYLDLVAAVAVARAFPNQGALCVTGSRLLVQDSIREKLMPKILEHASAIIPKDPLDEDCGFGSIVNEAHMNKILGYIESGKAEGAKLILGGNQVLKETGGFYIEPTIFDQVDPKSKIAQEEIFGPVLSVIGFKDEAEALEIANNTCFGLSGYAATKDVGRVQRIGEELSAGSIIMIGSESPSWSINVSLSVEAHKQSGVGYEAGLPGLAAYTVSTTVMCFT
ncbi:MAG: aldehyde dehydrogenase family protein [Porticoccaceae bacterium]|nr:aldehyde dehydrogenase family protein [Porticoccaceae bacterium]